MNNQRKLIVLGSSNAPPPQQAPHNDALLSTSQSQGGASQTVKLMSATPISPTDTDLSLDGQPQGEGQDQAADVEQGQDQ